MLDRPLPLRVAIVADLAEERWPSMDLVADMLMAHLANRAPGDNLHVELLRPSFGQPSGGPRAQGAFERYRNRFWTYPRWLKARASSFDLFHVVDHSYAHVVHELPADRTLVTCHDVDAFLPLIDPPRASTRLPSWLTRRVLSGLQKAAHVSCVSHATRDDLRRYELVPDERLSVVHNGVHPELTAQPTADAEDAIAKLAGPSGRHLDLVHVGSTIARKRIDVLLAVFAAVRQVEPRARLLKAGGALTDAQRAMARDLGLEPHIVQLPFLATTALAALYRRASAVLVTAEREGFGLPVVEALACGAPVVATDLPVLREVGGDAVAYCALDRPEQWRDVILAIARETDAERCARLSAALRRSEGFTWRRAAEATTALYCRLSCGESGQSQVTGHKSQVGR